MRTAGNFRTVTARSGTGALNVDIFLVLAVFPTLEFVKLHVD